MSKPERYKRHNVFRELNKTLEIEANIFASIYNQMVGLRLNENKIRKVDFLDESLQLNGISKHFYNKKRVQNDMIKQEIVQGLIGEMEILKILKVILSVIVIALAGYGLITKNFEFMPYMMLFLGVFMLVMGISELQAKKKTSAISFILAAAFLFFVAIYTF